MSRSLELRLAKLEKRLTLLERQKKKWGKAPGPTDKALQDLGLAFLMYYISNHLYDHNASDKLDGFLREMGVKGEITPQKRVELGGVFGETCVKVVNEAMAELKEKRNK